MSASLQAPSSPLSSMAFPAAHNAAITVCMIHQVSVPTCWSSQAAWLVHTRPYPRWWLFSCQVPWSCSWFVVSVSGLWSVFAIHGQVSYQRQGINFCQRFFRGHERVVDCPGRDVVKFELKFGCSESCMSRDPSRTAGCSSWVLPPPPTPRPRSLNILIDVHDLEVP